MKLYASTVCVGLIVVFFCNAPKQDVISDFCRLTAADIVRLQKLTDAEIAALTRPRKEAILSLRKTYKRECVK